MEKSTPENSIKWKHIAWLRLILSIAGILILCLIYVYALEHSWDELLKDLAPNLIAACISIVIAYSLFRGMSDGDQLKEELAEKTTSLIREEVKKTSNAILSAVYDIGVLSQSIIPVTPRQIKEHLVTTMTNITEYWFLGNSGSHFSTVTLPHMAGVEASSREVSVSIQLLDPESIEGCRRYADDRKKANDEVVKQLYARLLLVFIWSRTNPRLRLRNVSVRPTPTQFRVDWSPRACVVTTEGQNDPGLALLNLSDRPNHLHAKVRDQLDAALEGGRKIIPPKSLSKILPGTKLTDVADTILNECLSELVPASLFSAGWAKLVIEMARMRRNPYE